MADKWFESVAVAQRRAKRHLPRSLYMQLVGGSERVREAERGTAKGVDYEDTVEAQLRDEKRRTARVACASAAGSEPDISLRT